jgi:tetratricopeptide (TPR) repeat protein
MTVLLLGLIVAMGLALWAYSAQQRAEQAKEQAITARQHAERSETRALLAVKQAETARQEATASANESMESFQQALVFVRAFLDQLNDEKTRKVPGFQPVRNELGEIALKYYKELLQWRGDDPSVREQVWNLLGGAFYTQGKLEDAVAAYRKQLEIKPDHEYAWNNLGRVLYKQGKFSEAIVACRKQIAVKPDHITA